MMNLYIITRANYIIETPSGQVFVWDGSWFANGRHCVAPFIKRHLGVNRLAAVTLSHWHNDHVEGMAYIVDAFKGDVGGLYHSGYYSSGDGQGWTRPADAVAKEALMASLARWGVQEHYVGYGYSWPDPDVNITVANPFLEAGTGGTTTTPASRGNDMWLRFEYGDFVLLLSSDMPPSDTEDALEIVGPATIIKGNHHGEYMTERILDLAQPDLVIVENAYPDSAAMVHNYEGKTIETFSRFAATGATYTGPGKISCFPDGTYTVEEQIDTYVPISRGGVASWR